jgi:iron complex outermembrane receptor protein
VPLNDAESQLTYFVNMPDFVSSVKRIQVQRGAGGSTNGAGSFGASVHFQTQDIEPLPYARLQSGIGSYNTFRNTFSAGTGLLKSKFAFDLRLSTIQSKGYIDRAFSKLYSGFFQLAYINTKNLFKCIYFPGFETTYQAWYYVPDSMLKTHRTFNPAGMYVTQGKLNFYDNETDNYQQHNFQWHWVHQFKSHWNSKYTWYYTKGKGYYEQFKAQESLSAYFDTPLLQEGDTIYSSDLVRQLWLDNNAMGQIFNVNYTHTLLDIQMDALPDFNPTKYYSNSAQKQDANAFIRIQYTALKRTSLFVDVQNRLVNYAYSGITAPLSPPQPLDTLFLFFNPKVGLAYSLLPEITVNLSFAKAQKEPNRDDFINSTPLSRPKPEVLDDYEIGLYWHKPSIEIQLQGYYMNYKNQLVLDGSINNVGAYNRVNVPKSFRRGLEFLITYQNSNLSCSFNACASQNIILEYSQYADIYDSNYNWLFQRKTTYNKSAIAFSPNVTSNFELHYKLNAFLGLQTYWRYVGKQFLDNSQSELKKINPYQVVDLGLQMSSFKRFKSLSMQLMVYNVLNTLYETTGYTYGYGIQNTAGQIDNVNFNHYATAAPLNLMLSLKWKW